MNTSTDRYETWIGALAKEREQKTEPLESALKRILEWCLDADNWADDPDATSLYHFLSLCWQYDTCREMLYRRMADDYWPRERRENFIRCIESELTDEGRQLVEQAKAKDGHKAPVAAEPEVHEDDLDLQKNAKGNVRETSANMLTILGQHDHWRGRLQYDEFAATPCLDGKPVDQLTESEIILWTAREYQFGGNNRKLITDAIDDVAMKNRTDTLTSWIEQLPPWDTEPRLRTWMVDLCGADGTDTTVPWISYVTIMQMVARAIQPGCVARFVPIWQGRENTGKSRAIRALGHPFSMVFDISMDNKEAHMAIQGRWVAELAELDTMRKTAETKMKSFISQQEDSYVPKYKNHLRQCMRRCVFIGSTNEETYLSSLTGNTRWLPTHVGEIDVEGLEAIRDQLLAEALAIHKGNPGIKWWEEPEAVKEALRENREERRMFNSYEDDLRQWLDGENSTSPIYRERTTWKEIAEEYLSLEKHQWRDKALQAQITDALKALGWERKKTNKTSHWKR